MSVDVADLFRTHRPVVAAIVRQRGVPERWREDIAQEVFVALAERAGELDDDRVEGWIRVVAHRQSRDWRELRMFSELLVQPDAIDLRSANSDPERAMIEAERAEAVHRLLDGIDPVLARIDIDGLSWAAAALELSVTVGTVQGRLYRARAKLRARIDRLLPELRR